jgi:mannonate dehydratase
MKVLIGEHDLSDDYLRFAAQIGADGFDLHDADNVPGVAEQGFADADGMRALIERLRRYGLELFRVTPPWPLRYLLGEPEGERELDLLCRTLEAFGQAGVRMMLVPLFLYHGETNDLYGGIYLGEQRGGYRLWAFDQALMRKKLNGQPLKLLVEPELFFERGVRLYERLVPIAEAYGVKLILHPSDPQLPETELSTLRWSKLIDAVPSPNSGFLYCVGTRYETGVPIHDDIRAFGRRGKIFHVHFRNVCGTIPVNGGYEETSLDDGDMNMFRVLQSLKAIGYDGGLQVDHLPVIDGDVSGMRIAAAYAVGYIKALLRALEE